MRGAARRLARGGRAFSAEAAPSPSRCPAPRSSLPAPQAASGQRSPAPSPRAPRPPGGPAAPRPPGAPPSFALPGKTSTRATQAWRTLPPGSGRVPRAPHQPGEPRARPLLLVRARTRAPCPLPSPAPRSCFTRGPWSHSRKTAGVAAVLGRGSTCRGCGPARGLRAQRGPASPGRRSKGRRPCKQCDRARAFPKCQCTHRGEASFRATSPRAQCAGWTWWSQSAWGSGRELARPSPRLRGGGLGGGGARCALYLGHRVPRPCPTPKAQPWSTAQPSAAARPPAWLLQRRQWFTALQLAIPEPRKVVNPHPSVPGVGDYRPAPWRGPCLQGRAWERWSGVCSLHLDPAGGTSLAGTLPFPALFFAEGTCPPPAILTRWTDTLFYKISKLLFST